MVKVEFNFNEDHDCFQNDLWFEIDRVCNIMKQNIYKSIKDKNSNTVGMELKVEADGPVIESNGNICGHWNVTKNYKETF